jgi:capsular polysaccharide transport system ATP-binding protein
MITVENLHKRYRTPTGMGKWVLKGLTFTIPANTNVGIIGGNGAGKSTLLRILGGVDQPSKGRVERNCRMSWPMGYGGGLQGSLTGRQNARFVCRIYGHEEDIKDRVAFIEDFAEIGPAFDEPVRSYSSGMRSRLNFGMSLAFDFDVYISDEVTAAGDAKMKQKAADAFKSLAQRSGLLMAAHSESTLKRFCQSGLFLEHGQVHWFDDIDDALKAYKESIGLKK